MLGNNITGLAAGSVSKTSMFGKMVSKMKVETERSTEKRKVSKSVGRTN